MNAIVLDSFGRPFLNGTALMDGASIRLYQSGVMVPCYVTVKSGVTTVRRTDNGAEMTLYGGGRTWADWGEAKTSNQPRAGAIG